MKAEEEHNKGGRGGRREGAGRPKGDRRLFSFRIEEKLADYIESHESRTEFICDCIDAGKEFHEVVVVDGHELVILLLAYLVRDSLAVDNGGHGVLGHSSAVISSYRQLEYTGQK